MAAAGNDPPDWLSSDLFGGAGEDDGPGVSASQTEAAKKKFMAYFDAFDVYNDLQDETSMRDNIMFLIDARENMFKHKNSEGKVRKLLGHRGSHELKIRLS